MSELLRQVEKRTGMRIGEAPRRPLDAELRFWLKVHFSEDGCWQWTAATESDGYGCHAPIGGTTVAHRIAYQFLVGPIPAGLTLDHLCRNPGCVNPAHLEPVTTQVNTARAYVAPTHCPKGHEYTPENTKFESRDGGKRRARVCRRCRNALKATYKPAQRARRKLRDLGIDPSEFRP